MRLGWTRQTAQEGYQNGPQDVMLPSKSAWHSELEPIRQPTYKFTEG